jgi:hypothetical protein
VSDLVDLDTRRTKVRIAFANPDGRLKPNMFANAIFDVPQKSAVFVPNSALIMAYELGKSGEKYTFTELLGASHNNRYY